MLLPAAATRPQNANHGRVYVRRERTGRAVDDRPIGNENELLAALEMRAFTVAFMSALSLADRVGLLHGLESFVTQSGANEFNLIFAEPQPRRIVVIEAGRAHHSPFWPSQMHTSGVVQQLWPTAHIERFLTIDPRRRDDVNVTALLERCLVPSTGDPESSDDSGFAVQHGDGGGTHRAMLGPVDAGA
eukprot:3337804-Prymnesium_polylepis.1